MGLEGVALNGNVTHRFPLRRKTIDFEALPKERFRIENDQGIERIVIPAGRNWFIILFLGLWLIGWSSGGVVAISQALQGEAFVVIWLAFWFVGILFAGSWLGWQITGRETLAVANGALERGWSLLGIGRTKRYDLSQVKRLASAAAPYPYSIMRVSYPPFFPVLFGAVKWNYGAATIHCASGPTEAEGFMIVDRLQKRMPASASVE